MPSRGPIKKYPIVPILESFGLEHVPPGRSGRAKVRCPFHGDTRPSAQIDLTNQRFRCFTCEVSGDALDLLVSEEHISLAAAIDRAEALTGGAAEPVRRAEAAPPALFGRPRAGRGGS